ncbi:putative pre-mRNA-splicing factor ATP-dependent RNA helicase [Platanthera zijinensis]|uniref:RNA helicase n=1 Tax=Platanthera zijinensis TaxID=2320716 RepID=A0AAP0BKC3_9ASPA
MVIQDEWNLNEEGSNSLILPGKRFKTNGKAKGKVSRNYTAAASPALSKTKRRKLQKLQEEKEKKLMLSKSIKILQKYKIRDVAYSILQSSGTIGQAETLREKRRLAVQFSKAGLEIPDSVSLFKKENKFSENDVIVRRSDQGKLIVCSDEGLRSMEQIENDDYVGSSCKKFVENYNCNGVSHVKSLENDIYEVAPDAELVVSADTSQQYPLQTHLGSGFKMSVNTESDIMLSSLECAKKVGNKVVNEDIKSSIPASCIRDNQNSSSLQSQGADEDNKYAEKLEAPMHFATNDHRSPAIVVHVSRPHEVEEKREDLPIIMSEQEIMEAINEHPILILCGETGCGKTTQVPQFLYEAGYGSSNSNNRKGIIGITQPRRVAVLATAKRVSYEMGLNLGKEIGFQVRHDRMIGNDCSIKFMTDGILLREAQSDFLLKRYSVIIIDEAHERSLNTDILIGMLSRIVKIRQELYQEQHKKILSGGKISPENLVTGLKLVLMSATLRVEDFVSNQKLFQHPPPVLKIDGRQYTVTVHFSKKTPEDYVGLAYKKVLSIHKKLPPGGILVFVTGQREVEHLCKKLRKASQKKYDSSIKKKMKNETPTISDQDMKDIDDAFWAEDNNPNRQTGRFCSYEDELEVIDEHSSESESDYESDESVEDSKTENCIESENQEGDGSVLDFLKKSECLSSLKASFEALAGKIPKGTADENPGVQHASQIKKSSTKRAVPVGPLYVLPLYAMLPASGQLRVFEKVPEGERLVVVATNVAETSLTIPYIKYVVDTGKEKVKNYNYGNGMASFEVQWISKASAAQRAGRAGRTRNGHCFRLYSSAAFSKDDIFPEFSCPEISKVPVDGVVLLMKSLAIDKVENFPFPTPPKASALEEAQRCLKATEALDEEGKITSLGRAMAHYPMSPRHSCMIITTIQNLKNQRGFARTNLVLGYAVAAAAALSFPNPFLAQFEGIQELENHGDEKAQEKPESKKKMKATAKESRARFCNARSDALTIAYALQLFELADSPFEFCRNHSFHLKTMEEMSKLRKQILQMIFRRPETSHGISWEHGSFKDVEIAWSVHYSKHPLQLNEEELLAQAICAGWADRVAKRIRTISPSSTEHKAHAARYQSCASDDTIYLHRRSSVSSTAPEFVVYNELLRENRPYMHGVTAVKSDWLVRYAKSLCCFSAPLGDPKPFYEPLTDRTYCWVNPVFGRHNWELPLLSLPIKNKNLRVSVFACALLEGNVLPCLKIAKDFLAATPSSMLRPEALGHRRVGDLLRTLKKGSRTVDTRAKLKEMWSENPVFLRPELRSWFQEKFHSQFEQFWEKLLQEVELERFELFPKRAKKDNRAVS